MKDEISQVGVITGRVGRYEIGACDLRLGASPKGPTQGGKTGRITSCLRGSKKWKRSLIGQKTGS